MLYLAAEELFHYKSRIYVQEEAIDSRNWTPDFSRRVGADSSPVCGLVSFQPFGFSDSVALYPVDGQGTPAWFPASIPTRQFFLYLVTGARALVGVLGSYSADVMRVDLASGRRELFKTIGPSDPAGVDLVDAAFTPDGKSYARSLLCSALSQPLFGEGIAIKARIVLSSLILDHCQVKAT